MSTRNEPMLSTQPTEEAITLCHDLQRGLEAKIIRQSYETWIKPWRGGDMLDRVLYVRVPSPEFQHLVDKYRGEIASVIAERHLPFRSVQLVVAETAQERDDSEAMRAVPDHVADHFPAFVTSDGWSAPQPAAPATLNTAPAEWQCPHCSGSRHQTERLTDPVHSYRTGKILYSRVEIDISCTLV